MLHRVKKEKDYNKDKWIGIGGKFLETESPEDCVMREVLEETGLTMNADRLEYRGIVTFVSTDKGETYSEFMHLFWCDDFSGEIIECDEGNLEWVEKSRMNDLPHWEGDEIFLDLLEKRIPFFSLKLIYQDGQLKKAVLNGKEYLNRL